MLPEYGRRRATLVKITALVAGVALVAVVALRAGALSPSPDTTWESGTPITSGPSRTVSVAVLMHDQLIADRSPNDPVHPREEEEGDFRESLPENPRSPAVAQLPAGGP